MLKIAIDISQIIYGTGVSAYTENLVRALLKIDGENGYLLYGGSFRRQKDILKVFPRARVFPISPGFGDFVWNRLHLLPIEKLIGKVDILHTSDWTEPPAAAFKVTTVHDLYAFKFPKLIHPKILEVQKRKIAWVLKESQRVIVPSNSTKEDLVALGMNQEKIRVIPEAPTLAKASAEKVKEARKKYNLWEDYLISVGITKLKNTENVVRAFHLGSAGKDIKLVLVGRPVGVKISEQRNLRILGYVPKEDLAALLTGSLGLIYPSLYEGFGLPILDAFACEVPVVTSKFSAMREIAYNAAEVVDPYEISSIASGIEKILKSPKSYIKKGLAKVRDYSWEKNARETLKVYQELEQV